MNNSSSSRWNSERSSSKSGGQAKRSSRFGRSAGGSSNRNQNRNSNQGNRSGNRGSFGNRNRFARRGESQIDIESFISKVRRTQEQLAALDTNQEIEVTRTFQDYNLSPKLQKNIDKLGFSKPTPIQDQVFDLVRTQQNVLGLANTGTGKTGAFLIPLIERLLVDSSQKILVVAPTRELAEQISASFADLTRGLNFYSVICIGGANINSQMRNLSRNYQAVIGTPGRLLDLDDRRKIDFSKFKVVVLDEVDRMLDMGFVDDIRTILSLTPSDRQSLYFSATINDRISRLISQLSQNVQTVSVSKQQTTSLINQAVIKYSRQEEKIEKLHDLLISSQTNKVLIFGRTKHGVNQLMYELQDRGFRTESIHGNKSQAQRRRALEAFRKNRVDILVATDVAARGLDIEDVSHVVNYELPASYEDYIHRIGRTGRGGKHGQAVTFVK